MLKTLLLLIICISVGIAQMVVGENIGTPEKDAQFQNDFETKVIGSRTTVYKISDYYYLVFGKLFGRDFVAKQTYHNAKYANIVEMHLDNMQVMFIPKADVGKFWGGNKIQTYALCGNSVAGFNYESYTGSVKLNNSNPNNRFIEFRLDYSKYTDTVYIKNKVK